MTLVDIPDSVVFALQDGTHVYHLPLHRRNNAYFKDGDKNAYFSLILEKYSFPFDSLHYAWDKLLALSDIKGKTGVCSRITDLSGKVSTFASGALEKCSLRRIVWSPPIWDIVWRWNYPVIFLIPGGVFYRAEWL